MAVIDSFSQLIFNIYEAFTVAFFVREREHLRCLSSVSFANSFDNNRLVPIDGTLPGWVVKHNEPLIIPNFDKDEGTLGYYGADEDIKSFMGYPMDTNGVVVVDSKKKWVFTDKEKKILSSFVSVIHEEIKKEKRFRDIEEKNEELGIERKILNLFSDLNFSRITVKDLFREVLDLSGADLCFTSIEKNGKVRVKDMYGIDDEAYALKICPEGGSIASLVVESERELLLPYSSGFLREKPLFFPGETIKAKQLFGFPLVAHDMTIGVVGFVALGPRHLRESSIGLLRNVSALLSLYYSSMWMRENLESMKDFEPVTGSIQFTTFLSIMERTIRAANRFSLLSVKVRDLNVFNKKMGHEFTNRLLQKVFQVIRHCVGTRAFITREGGGRFFVLLKERESMEAANVLKILNYTVSKNMPEEIAVNQKGMTEMGIAHFPEDGKNLWDLLERARSRKILSG